jgi:hypothetical protein
VAYARRHKHLTGGADVLPGHSWHGRRSTDGGQTFSPHLTRATGGATSPVVAIDSCGGIDVAYAGATDIFFTRSTDGGSTFTPPTNRSNSVVSEFNPLIAISGKNAYMTWEDSSNVYFQTIKVCP